MAGIRRRRHQPVGETGITLLEVLIAISLLGAGFAGVFSAMQAALRSGGRLEGYQQSVEFATEKLNELVLDPTVTAGQQRSGVSPGGIRWEMNTELVDTRPQNDPDKPAQLVRIDLQVSWAAGKGTQRFSLQTLKLYIPEPPSS